MYKTLATGTYTKAIFHHNNERYSTTKERQFRKCMECGYVDMAFARYNAIHDKTDSCIAFSRWCEQKHLILCPLCVSLLQHYKGDMRKLCKDSTYVKHCATLESENFPDKWLHPAYSWFCLCSYVQPVATTRFGKMVDLKQAGVKYILQCGYGSRNDGTHFAIVGDLKYPFECYLGEYYDDRGELCDNCVDGYVLRRKLVFLSDGYTDFSKVTLSRSTQNTI